MLQPGHTAALLDEGSAAPSVCQTSASDDFLGGRVGPDLPLGLRMTAPSTAAAATGRGRATAARGRTAASRGVCTRWGMVLEEGWLGCHPSTGRRWGPAF